MKKRHRPKRDGKLKRITTGRIIPQTKQLSENELVELALENGITGYQLYLASLFREDKEA